MMRAHLRREYDALFPLLSRAAPRLFPRALFTWDAFLWAHAAYASRCFPRSCLPGGSGDGADAALEALGDAEADGVLVPLLDIVNHAPEGADMCASRLRMRGRCCADACGVLCCAADGIRRRAVPS